MEIHICRPLKNTFYNQYIKLILEIYIIISHNNVIQGISQVRFLSGLSFCKLENIFPFLNSSVTILQTLPSQIMSYESLLQLSLLSVSTAVVALEFSGC